MDDLPQRPFDSGARPIFVATWAELTGRLRDLLKGKNYSAPLDEIMTGGSDFNQMAFSVVSGIYTLDQYRDFFDTAGLSSSRLSHLGIASEFEAATRRFLEARKLKRNGESPSIMRRKLRALTQEANRFRKKLTALDPLVWSAVDHSAPLVRAQHEEEKRIKNGMVQIDDRGSVRSVDAAPYFRIGAAAYLVGVIWEAAIKAETEVGKPPDARSVLVSRLSASLSLPRTTTTDQYEADPNLRIRGPLVELVEKMLAIVSNLDAPDFGLPDAFVAVGRSAIRTTIYSGP